MKNCAFTIVAKNYVGLAQILEKSIRKYYSDLDFYIIIADEVNEKLREELPHNVLIAKDTLGIGNDTWNDMSFKYNLTEFCTAIKPASFQYFFSNHNYEKCIYLDPDIYFFDSIGKIYDMLDTCQILLTPHITQISDNVMSDAPEKVWLSCGIFNLGFCGLRRGKASTKMLSWWHKRLVSSCFIAGDDFLFTDQKWIDFLPAFFTADELHITTHLGMNVAPWNFFEREVCDQSGEFRVKPRYNNSDIDYPLIFVHYSGYNYTELKKGRVVQNNISSLANYPDIEKLTAVYTAAISSQSKIFDRFITQFYSYNFFDNGDTIQVVHRRLYRSMVDKGRTFEAPFSTINGSFYSLLKSHKMIKPNRVNLEKVNKNNLQGVVRKLLFFNKLSRIVYRVLGYERYMLLIRLLHPFARFESQIHLLDKKYDSTNIY